MTTTNESQAATTMSEEELSQTALGLCTDYLQGRCWSDVHADGGRIVGTDGGEVVLVTVRATMEPGSEALPTLDLADHGDVDAIRHDAISIAITGERRAKLRHLVGVWQWAERM